MKASEMKERFAKFPDVLDDDQTEVLALVALPDGTTHLLDVSAVLFGGGQLIFSVTGLAPPPQRTAEEALEAIQDIIDEFNQKV